jgi:CheY-like chemotaxis protein
MSDNYQTPPGDVLFEAFVEQVKQALEHLYDFAFLQQHELARIYDSESDLAAKTAGRKLRHELITAIESLRPNREAHFRAPNARLYNILHLHYIENLTIQEVALEQALSERQAYRDLKRGQESVAAVLWSNRLPPASAPQEFSLESEVARFKLRFSPVDIQQIFKQACTAVERLALQQSVQISVKTDDLLMSLSTDPALAHQVMISLLSYTIQQAQPGVLYASIVPDKGFVELLLRYRVKDESIPTTIADSGVPAIAQRLLWKVSCEDYFEQHERLITLHMASSSTKLLIIDDSEGWIELVDRFLEGLNCQVIPSRGGQESLLAAQELNPDAIILDVMMPERDGWELLQRLRAQPATANVPIIVCTVFNDPQLAYSLGASVFVPKPANRSDILDALKQVGVIG